MSVRSSKLSSQGSDVKHHFSLDFQNQETSCLKCHKSGDVLVCSNWDCPIVVHQSCMPAAARFDNTGNFYCPYCLYKQSLLECHQAQEKALSANKALVNFLKTRTWNDAGLSKYCKTRDDSSWIKIECKGVRQSLQVGGGQQCKSCCLETHSGNQQQAGSTRSHNLVKESAANDDGILTKKCRVSEREVEGSKSGMVEEVQTQEDNTKGIYEKSDNRSEGMLHNGYCMINPMMKKLANAGQPHETGDCGITFADKLQLQLPKQDFLFTGGDTALVTQYSRNSTNEHKETANKVEEYLNEGVGREKMQRGPSETPWCITGKNILEMNEELYKENHFAPIDECFLRTPVVENFDQPAEIGKDISERTDERVRKEKVVVHPARNNRASLPYGKLENSTINYTDFEQTVKIYNRVVDKVQIQEERKETSVFCVGVDNAPVINDKPCGLIDSACQDDCFITRDTENDEGPTNLITIKAAYPTSEDNDSLKVDEMGYPIKVIQKTSNLVGHYYNGRVGKEQTLKESQVGYVCLTKENPTATSELLDKVKDSVILDDCFLWDEAIENKGNGNQSAGVRTDFYGSANGSKSQVKAPQDAVCPTKENIVIVRHESGSLTRTYPKIETTLEGYHDSVEEIEQMQTELKNTRDDDNIEIAEEFDTENHISLQDACLRSEIIKDSKDSDRISSIGEDHCGTTDEGKTWVESPKYAPQVARNESASVSHEEFGSAEDSESSNTDHLEHGLHVGQKRQLEKSLDDGMQHWEISGCAENEIEEYKRVRSRPKVESIKQIKRSTILPVARRRKLPWTVPEVEMLKVRDSLDQCKCYDEEEGMQKFLLTANKNLPWMKIMEFGRHIFDGTRTPGDLKDKWKNIKGKGHYKF